jgi:predicted phosphohydrolase
MNLYAISDLHLSLRGGVLAKPQDRFGPGWVNHHTTIASDWRERVGQDDLVLVPGDISWASKLEDASEDLNWLDGLPGRKILVEGNHDWWLPSSRKKAREALPPSVHLVQHDSVLIEDVLFFGTRLWVMPDLAFPLDDWNAETGEAIPHDGDQDAKILNREIERLKLSIGMARQACREHHIRLRICMLHFPPTDFTGRQTAVTRLLADCGTDICVFGHVHGFGSAGNGVVVDGVRYFLTTCDYLGFKLLPICP